MRLTSFLISLMLLMVCGLVHGLWADRWQESGALEAALARVPLVPLEFGDWKAKALEGDAAAFEQVGARAYWMRSYANPRRKLSVLAILMCGRSGRMAVHTPEVCYAGAGFEIDHAPALMPINSEEGRGLGSFWTARFYKPGGRNSNLRLLWSWSADGSWEASAAPRWEFRGRPFLYKLYVAHDGPESSAAPAEASSQFLREFVPELERTLFAKP